MPRSPARRAKLRARRQEEAAKAARIVELRGTAGHSCADCLHRDRRNGHHTCALGDEWDCYLIITLDHLCWQWKPKP